MGRRMIVNGKCPICGKPVEQVPDSVLKQHPHQNDAEIVVTKRGLKQYIHSSCWYDMIKNKKPYNGRMFV